MLGRTWLFPASSSRPATACVSTGYTLRLFDTDVEGNRGRLASVYALGFIAAKFGEQAQVRVCNEVERIGRWMAH